MSSDAASIQNSESDNLSDYIGKGLSFSSLPPRIRKALNEHFEIPQQFADLSPFSPSPMLSLAEAANFPVPAYGAKKAAKDIPGFFSKSAPQQMDQSAIHRLRRMAMPDPKTVHRLVECKRQMLLDGFQSVQFSHLDGTVTSLFPMWAVTWWETVVDFKEKVREPLGRGVDWVAKQRKVSRTRR
ncbi:hypothetical protein C8F01DRAFT_1111656 [Mycena amicta]|nr:hypothetical protein C8F01DRAFT_1111656 [Mycena amicta]